MSSSPVKSLEREERELERTVDLLTCPECGAANHDGPCAMTTHRMIQRHIDRMDEEETGYWMNRVQSELPTTSRQLAMQLVARRVQILARGNPEKATELTQFLSVAQELLTI